MIRLGGLPVRGFALGADDSIEALVTAKLAEGGYPNVSSYQQAKNLKVDGDAGTNTLKAMGLGYLFDLAGRGMLKPGQTQLETKNTPLSPEEAAQALSAGYQAVTGTAPTPEILALLVAQSGHETSNWQKMPNYAFGGVKASAHDKYVQAFVTTEGKPPKKYVLAFAAYPTVAEGAEAYVRTLKSRTNWWNGLQSGTPEGLITGLTAQPYAYFTGSAKDYLASVRSKVSQFADLARSYAHPIEAFKTAVAAVAPYVPSPSTIVAAVAPYVPSPASVAAAVAPYVPSWPVVPPFPGIPSLPKASTVALYATGALALAAVAAYAVSSGSGGRERARA